jgi:hypothetical protein
MIFPDVFLDVFLEPFSPVARAFSLLSMAIIAPCPLKAREEI